MIVLDPQLPYAPDPLAVRYRVEGDLRQYKPDIIGWFEEQFPDLAYAWWLDDHVDHLYVYMLSNKQDMRFAFRMRWSTGD